MRRSPLPADQWLVPLVSRPEATLRLFCFPHAAGGTALFRNWPALAPTIEFHAFQLPGRETRIRERPYTDATALVAEMIEAIEPYLDRPFAVFGHSMGAILGFEFARQLSNTASRQPSHLFVAACRAPHLPMRRKPLADASDEDIIGELRMLGGSPEDVLNSEELMAFLLPLVRADLSVYETYRLDEPRRLSIPIAAFGTSDDFGVTADEIAAWRHYTNVSFALHMLQRGGHFFPFHATEQFLALVRMAAEEHPACSPQA